MPGGDGTGPNGLGPMTGRAAGFCSGNGIPGYANYSYGRGFRALGRGRGGGGRGFRNRFYATGLTGWQRAAGGIPAWNNPFAYGGYYQVPAMPFAARNTELDSLKAQAEYLEDTLETIQRQIRELEGKISGTSSRKD